MQMKNQLIAANKLGLAHSQTGNMASYYTPSLQVAYNLGCYDNVDISASPIVSGYRYGAAPECFLSTNYAEQKSEIGLSMAAIEGEREISSAIWFNSRQRYNYTGILVGRGSDGEALILAFDAPNLD